MTITFEIDDDTAAHIWSEIWQKGQTKEQVTKQVTAQAKAYLESEATKANRNFPYETTLAREAFRQLPES